jgi:phage tail P2-like protein
VTERPSLLPPNSTALERAIEQATAGALDYPLDWASWRDPEQCPAHLLPWLAWEISVDHWSPDWPEARKRAAIAGSVAAHRLKGTPEGVRVALEREGIVARVEEWWEAGLAPHRFRVRLRAAATNAAPGGGPVTRAMLDRARRTIGAAKPVREVLDRLNVDIEADAPLRLAAGASGSALTRAPMRVRASVSRRPAVVRVAGAVTASSLTRAVMTLSEAA